MLPYHQLNQRLNTSQTSNTDNVLDCAVTLMILEKITVLIKSFDGPPVLTGCAYVRSNKSTF